MERQLTAEEKEAAGRLLLSCAKRVVDRRYLGKLPPGYAREDVVSEIVVRAWRRVQKWRPGGKIPQRVYFCVCCRFAMLDFIRGLIGPGGTGGMRASEPMLCGETIRDEGLIEIAVDPRGWPGDGQEEEFK